MRRHPSKLIFAASLSAAVIGAISCTSNEPAKPSAPTTRVPLSTARHSVQTPELQALMGVIGNVAGTYAPATRPVDVESPTPSSAELDRAYAQAVILADALVTAADRIPQSLENKPLTPDVREGFLAEVEMLRQGAVDLKSHAVAKQGESMSRALDRINATCITCHTRYRDLTGTLDSIRAHAWGWERSMAAQDPD